MVSLGLAIASAMMLGQIMGQGLKSSASVEVRSDLELIRNTIVSRLDCKNTLRITSSTTVPLACGSFTAANYGTTWSLRRPGGTNSAALDLAPGGKIGTGPKAWTITAKCDGNDLVIGATRSGNDPVSGKPFTSLPEATDLFRGGSAFCHEFFDDGYWSCSGTYNFVQGRRANGQPNCCRFVSERQTTSGGGGVATCGANEYVASGGGSCWAETQGGYAWLSGVATTPGVKDLCAGPTQVGCFNDGTIDKTYYLPARASDSSNPAWVQECHQPITNVEAKGAAFAVCCPKS
jgi:hypothetical protein